MGCKILKLVTWPWPRPFQGQFVIGRLVHAMVNYPTSLKSIPSPITEIWNPCRSFPCCRPFPVQSVEHFYSILSDFNSQRARAAPQWQLGFSSSSVKLHGRRTISGKLLVFGFVTTMQLLPNYFDLLFPVRSSMQLKLGSAVLRGLCDSWPSFNCQHCLLNDILSRGPGSWRSRVQEDQSPASLHSTRLRVYA